MNFEGYEEKISLLVEYADKERIPLILFTASGGDRNAGGNPFINADGKDFNGDFKI